MSSLVKIVLYILLLFNISISFGVKESSLAALLGTAGVTLGLALQGGLSNLAGGMMLLLFKPFQVGDYIIVNGQDGSEGTISKIEICYTTLLSIDNKHIVIPNGTLSNTTITNVTARDQRRLEIKVGISYNADIQKAKEILEDILTDDPDTREDEEMVVFVDELAESSVIMGFRVWVDTTATGIPDGDSTSGLRKILIITELRFLIISWMCICINKNEIIFEEKALLYGRKTAV